MSTQFYTASTLDGYIATADDSIDWLFSLDQGAGTTYPEFIADVGALAMGSATYSWLLRNAERVREQTGAAWPYTQPTWVFSTRQLPAVAGADIRSVRGDVAAAHLDMVREARGKNVWVVGGGDLAGQFFDADLLDEVIVQIGSVTLGGGKPLFPRDTSRAPWRLMSVRRFGSGLAELRYVLR